MVSKHTYKAVRSIHLTNIAENHEDRFVVVDGAGHVVDDNLGAGFKSRSAAIESYELKHKGYTTKDKEVYRSKKQKERARFADKKRDVVDLLEETEED